MKLSLPTPRRLFILAVLILLLAVAASIRLRLLDFPLERDEGEYAYAGQLMLQGVPPYEAAYNMKWPGTYGMYAILMAMFGQTTVGIHLGLILVTTISGLLVFLIARHIFGAWPGVVAAGTYSILSIAPSMNGQAAHATHFVVFFALGGIFLLLEPVSIRRIFIAGILLSLATLMKQVGAAFGFFAALWICWFTIRERAGTWRDCALRLLVLGSGGLIPLFLMLVTLAWTGVMGRFWLWTIQYGAAYVSLITPAQGMAALASMAVILFTENTGLWSLALLGLIFLCFTAPGKSWKFFLLSFTIFSFAAICPGWYFRGHYFLLLVPVAGILSGYATQCLWKIDRKADRFIAQLIFPIAAAYSLYAERAFYFQATPVEACRMEYGNNPFPEAVEIGRYIRAHTPPDATIAVIGSEPEIYFYSHRKSATGYIYTYALMEPQPFASQMQREMARQIEAANPAFLIFVAVGSSWLQRENSDPFIFEWFDQYHKNFDVVGQIEILSSTQTIYHWAPKIVTENPSTNAWLVVFKNKKFVPLPSSQLSEGSHETSR